TNSSGTGSMLIDGANHIVATNNFFLYDSSDHTLRLQFVGDSTPKPVFKVAIFVTVPVLQPGTYQCPLDSGQFFIDGPRGTSNNIIPPYSDTIHLTITKVDAALGRISANFFVHMHSQDTLVGIHSVDSVMVVNAPFFII